MYIFITGTDTEVGKSYISKGLCAELAKSGEATAYLKPFQSGEVKGVLNDADCVRLASEKLTVKTGYVTKTPSTPLISAEIDNIKYDLEKITTDFEELKKTHDNVIVEGSGGIYVPVKRGVLMSDVIKKLNLPALIVARPDLGTINHTLMTIDCLLNNNIKVLGVVISNYPSTTTDPVITRAKEMIEMFSGDVKVLEIVKQGQKDFSRLANAIMDAFTIGCR